MYNPTSIVYASFLGSFFLVQSEASGRFEAYAAPKSLNKRGNKTGTINFDPTSIQITLDIGTPPQQQTLSFDTGAGSLYEELYLLVRIC